jgi:outer membrane protein OmpA-like peptidoglycan-associated protein
MRNWCRFLVVGVAGTLLAMPGVSQQRNNVSGDEGTSVSVVPESSKVVTNAVPARSSFGLPASPQSKKPAAASAAKDSRGPGYQIPRYEVSGMYQYLDFSPGNSLNDISSHGVAGSFTYNASRWLGFTEEVGHHPFTRDLSSLGGSTSAEGSITSFLFGPRLNYRKFDYFVPFAEFLLGASHGSTELTGTASQNSFAVAAGGGIDVVLNKNWAWRFVQLDYLMTNHTGTAVSANGRQDNFRIGTGIVYRWGFAAPPAPPVNHPPVAACSANPVSLYEGSGDAVAIHVNASDADNDPLTYAYSATGGSVEGTGPDARWNFAGVRVGTYTVTAKVDDGKGGSASCAADVKVEPRPNRPPTATLTVERSPILQGEKTGVTCNGSDPDNDPLTYSWTSTGGQISGTGSNAQFDSTGLQPGTYPVKCAVSDGRGGNADASGNVEVKEPPQVKQLEAKLALHSIYFPTAQPTVAKPTGGLMASQASTLDALAADYKEYLKYRPAAHLILEGHADIRGGKEYNVKLSERRVERAKSYLIEHGVPADHLETKAFGFEKNMSSDEVKKLLEEDTELTPADKKKMLKNLLTVRLANNRRVDVTLSTTGEQSIRKFPFNAKDALTLLSRSGGEKASAGAAGKAPAKASTAKKPAAKP